MLLMGMPMRAFQKAGGHGINQKRHDNRYQQPQDLAREPLKISIHIRHPELT